MKAADARKMNLKLPFIKMCQLIIFKREQTILMNKLAVL